MSSALRVALTDPTLLILAGPRLGAIEDPSAVDIELILALVGGLTELEIARTRSAWLAGGIHDEDRAHDIFVAGAASRGADPAAASSLWTTLKPIWLERSRS